MTVLVTGATGNVGSQVVRELLALGVPVRAFVRDQGGARTRLGPDAELAVGDLSDASSVERALAGVDRVFLSSADGPDKVGQEAGVVDAAAAAGVRLIVKASTMLAEAGSPLPPLDWNGRGEEHLLRSGVPATLLRSGFYMTNMLMAAEQVRGDGSLVAPAGDGRIAMIDPRDVGAVAAVVLTEPGHAGRSYRLTGPEAIGYDDVAAELSRATGSPVRYVDVPESAARAGLAAAGMPGWLVEHLVGLFRLVRAGGLAEVTDDVRLVTGRAPRGFGDFAAHHAGVFGARSAAAAAGR
jgi:uncharacterized protein YbjT (DUF2867 family)